MTSRIFALLCVAACLPKAGVVEAPPDWETEDGRQAVWRDLAEWYIDNGLPGEAMGMVTRLRAEGEDSPELGLIQGKALSAQGVPDEARHVLEDVRKAMPHDPRPLEALGVVYSDLGEYELAVEVLLRAVDINPDNPVSRNNLGFLLLGLGRCDEATAQLERVIELDGTNARYRNNLAFSLVCQGDHQRALKLFRSTSNEADARYNMGIAYERLQKLPSAILQYRQALTVDPQHEQAQDALTRLAPLGLDLESMPPGAPQ